MMQQRLAQVDDGVSLLSALLGIRQRLPTNRAGNSLRWIISCTVWAGKFSNLAACCRVANDGIGSVCFSIDSKIGLLYA